MPNYAIVQDNVVINVIVAESIEEAVAATQLEAFETSGQPWIGWTLVDGLWTPPNEHPWIDYVIIDGVWVPGPPHDSWSWDGDSWQPPVPYPGNGFNYDWDEETQSWILSEIQQEI